jgi:chorismate mutase
MKEITQEAWAKRPLIISGPCSAETETQVMQTAVQLQSTGKVDIMRAGIWKPRTRPGSFEGIGTKGLAWMQKAREATGIPVAVEVATAKQVEDALHFDVDVLWIGARTTVNPFSVQDVADALRGVDVPVLIKNPINPDLELWIGAVERVAKAGIKQIGLIHRDSVPMGIQNTGTPHVAPGYRNEAPPSGHALHQRPIPYLRSPGYSAGSCTDSH